MNAAFAYAPPPVPQLRPVGVDVETHKIQRGNLTPPLVCVSEATRTGQTFDNNLYLRDHGGLAVFRRLLYDPTALIVIHNAPFDLGVACNEEPSLIFPIFDAFAEGRICCTITRQKLIDIAFGMRKFRRYAGKVTKATYDLGELIALYYNEVVQKKDTWRTSYALLDNIPLERWPPSAKLYAMYDAVLHTRAWEAQEHLIEKAFGGELPNQLEQQRTNWVLHLMSIWGIRAEKSRVDYFVKHCEEEIGKMRERLCETCIRCGESREQHNDIYCAGLPREEGDVDPPGFKNTGIFRLENKQYVRTMVEIRRRVVTSFTRRGLQVPMTDPSPRFPGGQVSTDKDTLEQTDDPYLHVLAESMTFDKHLKQWGPVLRAAVVRPVCCRYEILVETGRTASSGSEGQDGTNIQNPPRKGDVRPAIIPRAGWVFCSTDADTIELRAQAQNCLELVGWSKMAEAIVDQFRNGGPDLHERLAGNLVGVPAIDVQQRRRAGDVEMGEARQFSKVPGFGLWGGLGAETLVAYAAAQLSRKMHKRWFGLTREEQIKKARWIREVWFDTWPEAYPYFDIVGKQIDRKKGYGTIQQLMSRRIRGEVRFTAAANGYFQGRVADAMKEVLWRLGYECYTGRCSTCWARGCEACNDTGQSVLFGSRLSMFLHDEPILEHPEATVAVRAERQRQIMVEVLNRWMPDVPCTSSAVLMRRWQKGAEPGFLCGCGKLNGKKRCACGGVGQLVPVKPIKILSGVDDEGKEQFKVQWIHDDGNEEPMAVAA